jgi:hypothetical protein
MRTHLWAYYVGLLFGLHLITQIPEADGNYVLFENIGEMASSVSYLHVKVTLNLSDIDVQLQKFVGLLDLFNRTLVPTMGLNKTETDLKFKYETQLRWIHERHTNISRNIIALHIWEVNDLKNRLTTIRHILPLPSDGEEFYVPPRRYRGPRTSPTNETNGQTLPPTYQSSRYDKPSFGNRTKRGSGNTFLGIVGTFFGIYNTVQIQHLWTELSETKAGLSKLIELQYAQLETLKDIDITFQVLFQTMSLHTMQDPGLLDARLNRLHGQLLERIQIAEEVIQQAQHRRLSVQLLSQPQISKLFARLHHTAAKHGCELMIEHQSDLFQLETSYFFDSQNVHLLLHVPMVSPDSLLRLYKLHPFPIPLNSGHFMIPKPENDILAITAGNQRYSRQFSSSDLLACFTLNRRYMCESNGVLEKLFNVSCIGALYQQSMEGVNQFCNLQICKNTEVIRQLLGNWFAVFSPKPLTVPVECKNGTSKEIMVPIGVSKFHLSAGCDAHFESHLVVSDYSIREPADFIEYKWNWDVITIPQEILTPEVFIPAMDQLSKLGMDQPTINELKEFHMHLQRSPGWWAHFVHFAGNVFLIICTAAMAIILGIRFRRFDQHKRQQKLEALQMNHDPVNSKFIPQCD